MNSFRRNVKKKKEIPECKNITLSSIGIELGKPAFAETIINSEQALLRQLANCGYPLAAIENREVLVDALEKIVRVKVCVDIGCLARFGAISIIGLKDVRTSFIVRKLLWNEGEIYNENLVERSQLRLINTDLFSSVLISHENEVDASGQLPMKIRLSETKHRSFSFGATYATIDGPGVTVAWENRNMMNEGQNFSLDFSLSKIYSAGLATYSIPDFYRMDQYLVLQGKAARENIRVYTANYYSFETRVERSYTDHLFTSFGAMGEYIDVKESISNGKFTIVGLPISVKYTTVENVLDPLSGFTITYQATPYQAVTRKKNTFIRQTLTGSTYVPLIESRRVILAFRAQFGSLAGSRLSTIPFTKRFLGGSDDELRGYSFKTVSPLNRIGNPTGGRGAIYATAEVRMRVTEKIGIVPFFDIGRVTDKEYPEFTGKWVKSIGAGLRYYLFFGPLRIDVGVPLNRRSFDPHYRVYISIGQTF